MDSLFAKLVSSITGDKGPAKDYWVDDSKCRACYECETPFSVFVRRHHCRVCGRIFCANCTFNAGLPAARDDGVSDAAWMRVCNYCESRWREQQRRQASERRAPAAVVGRHAGAALTQLLLLQPRHRPPHAQP